MSYLNIFTFDKDGKIASTAQIPSEVAFKSIDILSDGKQEAKKKTEAAPISLDGQNRLVFCLYLENNSTADLLVQYLCHQLPEDTSYYFQMKDQPEISEIFSAIWQNEENNALRIVISMTFKTTFIDENQADFKDFGSYFWDFFTQWETSVQEEALFQVLATAFDGLYRPSKIKPCEIHAVFNPKKFDHNFTTFVSEMNLINPLLGFHCINDNSGDFKVKFVLSEELKRLKKKFDADVTLQDASTLKTVAMDIIDAYPTFDLIGECLAHTHQPTTPEFVYEQTDYSTRREDTQLRLLKNYSDDYST